MLFQERNKVPRAAGGLNNIFHFMKLKENFVGSIVCIPAALLALY